MKEELEIKYDNNIGLSENIQRMCESKDAYQEFEWIGQKGGDVIEEDPYYDYAKKYKCKGYKLANNLYVYELYIDNLLEHTYISDSESFTIIVIDWSTSDLTRPPFKIPDFIHIYSEHGIERLRIYNQYDQKSIFNGLLSNFNGQEYTYEDFKEKARSEFTREEIEKYGFYEESVLEQAYNFYTKIIRAFKEVIIEKNNEPENEVSEEQKDTPSSDEYVNVQETSESHIEGLVGDEIGKDELLDGLSSEELENRLNAINEENAKKQETIEEYKRAILKAKIKQAMADRHDLDIMLDQLTNQLNQLGKNTPEL